MWRRKEQEDTRKTNSEKGIRETHVVFCLLGCFFIRGGYKNRNDSCVGDYFFLSSEKEKENGPAACFCKWSLNYSKILDWNFNNFPFSPSSWKSRAATEGVIIPESKQQITLFRRSLSPAPIGPFLPTPQGSAVSWNSNMPFSFEKLASIGSHCSYGMGIGNKTEEAQCDGPFDRDRSYEFDVFKDRFVSAGDRKGRSLSLRCPFSLIPWFVCQLTSFRFPIKSNKFIQEFTSLRSTRKLKKTFREASCFQRVQYSTTFEIGARQSRRTLGSK